MSLIETRFDREALELSYFILSSYMTAKGSDTPAVVVNARNALQILLWPYWDEVEKQIKAKDVDCSSRIANKSLYETYFNKYGGKE